MFTSPPDTQAMSVQENNLPFVRGNVPAFGNKYPSEATEAHA